MLLPIQATSVQMTNIEELQVSLAETLTEMQTTLYEIRANDNTQVINQVNTST